MSEKPSEVLVGRVIRVRKSHPCVVCGENIAKSQHAVIESKGPGFYVHHPACPAEDISKRKGQARTDAEILAACRMAINKGWWSLSNQYSLYDKPISEVVAAFDRALALAKQEESEG